MQSKSVKHESLHETFIRLWLLNGVIVIETSFPIKYPILCTCALFYDSCFFLNETSVVCTLLLTHCQCKHVLMYVIRKRGTDRDSRDCLDISRIYMTAISITTPS